MFSNQDVVQKHASDSANPIHCLDAGRARPAALRIRARGGAAEPPNFEFLAEYFGFGFLFTNDTFAIPTLDIPISSQISLALLCLVLILFGVFSKRQPSDFAGGGQDPIAWWIPIVIAVACAVFMLWLGSTAFRRQIPLMALAVLPLLALAIPVLAGMARSIFRVVLPGLDRSVQSWPPALIIFVLYGLVAHGHLFIASFVTTILAPRAFFIFVPYVLLIATAGAVYLAQQRKALVAIPMVPIMIFAASVPYS